jgi:hypothetical protein
MCEKEPSRGSGSVEIVSLVSIFLETFLAGGSSEQAVCSVLLELIVIAVVDFVQRKG